MNGQYTRKVDNVYIMLLFLALIDTQEDKDRFEELYEAYCYSMFYIAFKILNDHGQAEDAVQEALIRIANNMDKVGPVSEPRTKKFALVIVHNIAVNMIKKKRDTVYESLDNYIGSIEFEDRVLNHIELEAALHLLNEMSPIYCDILMLNIYFEFSPKEISEIIGVSYETVRKRLQRGKQALQKALEIRGYFYR